MDKKTANMLLTQTMKEAGFVIGETGGGCTAWQMEIEGGALISICAEGGTSHLFAEDGESDVLFEITDQNGFPVLGWSQDVAIVAEEGGPYLWHTKTPNVVRQTKNAFEECQSELEDILKPDHTKQEAGGFARVVAESHGLDETMTKWLQMWAYGYTNN
jgi:hypothetical protein